MALYPEYYHQKKVHGLKHTGIILSLLQRPEKRHWRKIDHCINQIRQHIMCHGDSTPIPTKYFPGYGGNYIDADQVHTCRNFESLLQWTKSRHNGSEAVQPRNRDGTPKKLNFEEPWSYWCLSEEFQLGGMWLPNTSWRFLISSISLLRLRYYDLS